MILANHGATRAHIIVADHAGVATRRAAEELSRYIYAMTGARLTVHPASRGVIGNNDAAEICVGLTGRAGEPDISALKNDGYIHRLVGNRLFILSHSERGTLHGVYAFLEEELGCRFFTERVEHIPRRRYLAVDAVDKTVIPPFEYRDVCGNVCYDDDTYASKRGVNCVFNPLSEEYGGSILYHGFAHTFQIYVPVTEFFAEHPEYFSMIDGKRYDGGLSEYTGEGRFRAQTQLCLTNPDVIRIVTARLRQAIEAHPECRIFSISQNDFLNPCDCPECRRVDEEEGSRSGSLIRFINAIAADIAQDYPEVIIDTFAYQYSRKPPKLTKPLPNVCVRVCSIECCFSHPLRSCDELNARSEKNSFRDDLIGWGKICRRMYVWNYTTNFRHYMNPLPNLHVLQDNIRFFIENGVVGLFEQGNSEDLSGEFGELRYYILSKLMWEPDGDVERWMREFMAAYYGMAAQPIREYIDTLTRHVTEENIHVRLYDDPDKGHLPDWLLELAERKFDEAQALADNEAVLERVKRSRMHIRYCRICNMPMEDPARARLCEAFVDDVRHFGFVRIREGMPAEQSCLRLRYGTMNIHSRSPIYDIPG